MTAHRDYPADTYLEATELAEWAVRDLADILSLARGIVSFRLRRKAELAREADVDETPTLVPLGD